VKYALGFVALVAALSFAGASFDGGCAETFTIKGYAKAWIYMFGAENNDPGNSFRAYNWTTFQGKLADNVYAYLGTNYQSWNGNSAINVCDAYLNMNIIPELSIKAGQFKIPFGWAYDCSGGGLYFLDRAYLAGNDDFNNYGGRDVGVNLHGQFDMVGVDLAYFNGTGSYTDADTTVKKEFVARLTVEPTEWLTVAGGVAMIGQPQINDSTGAMISEDWSANGINAYALANYPLSENADLIFEGEYMQAGFAGPEVANVENNAGTDMYGMLGVKIGLQNSFLTSVMPAVRYEMVSPSYQLASGGTEPEDNWNVIDFCINCHITPHNTVQIGGRNWSFENDNMDGYTDMYMGWRINY